MKREDWLDYFESVNKRKPTPYEFLEAKESGLFDELTETIDSQEERLTSESDLQQQASPETSPIEKPHSAETKAVSSAMTPNQRQKVWLDSFESLNNHKPTSNEFMEAKQSGIFDSDEALPEYNQDTNPHSARVAVKELTEEAQLEETSLGPSAINTTVSLSTATEKSSEDQEKPTPSSSDLSSGELQRVWLEEFESQNNRKPSTAEFLDAKKRGEFEGISEIPRPFSQSNQVNSFQSTSNMTSEKAFNQLEKSFKGTEIFFKTLASKHQALIAIIVLAYIFFLIFGFKPGGSVTFGYYRYEVGSVFFPKKYTSGYGGTSLYGDKESDREMNRVVAAERNKNMVPMAICLLTMAGSAYMLNQDSGFQEKLYQQFKQKQEKGGK